MGILAEDNVKVAQECALHMGRFVKIKFKGSSLTLERKIDNNFIKQVSMGMFKVLTVL